ncbi:MAG TPA: YncE family protein [Rhodanobacteraceae bacterium]
MQAFGLVAVALLLSGTAAGHAAAPAAPLFPAPVYVTLQGSHAVEELPSGQVWTVPGAHFAAANRAGTQLLVSSDTQPDVYLLNTHGGKLLATFMVGASPQGVAISADGHIGLATSAAKGTLDVLDLVRHKIVKVIAVGKQPWDVQFAPDGKRAYVALQGGAAIAVIDTHAWRRVATIATPGVMPHTLIFAPHTDTLWVRGLTGNVAAIDLVSGKVRAVTTVGPSHAGIDVTPDGRYVFTGGIGGDEVDVLNARTAKVVARIDVGRGPHSVRVSPDGRWVYAGVTVTGKIAVIDAHTFKVVRQIPVHGSLPVWIVSAGN